MKSFFILLLTSLLTACTSGRFEKSTSQLNGTWVPVKQEIGGTSLPEMVYKNQQLIILDSSYTVIAESVDKGVVRIHQNHIDIYGKEGVNAGKHFTAIYQLQKGNLTVCYNLSGTDYPADFKTEGQPLYFLSVFKRVY